jgi:predicted RNase H-like HicB family nuclease
MDILDYTVIVEPLLAEDGGGYLARVPDLPGCMSDGETETEAYLNVQDAIVAWGEQAQAMHRPIPPPTRKRQYA